MHKERREHFYSPPSLLSENIRGQAISPVKICVWRMESCCMYVPTWGNKEWLWTLHGLNNWWFDKKHQRCPSCYVIAFRSGETEKKSDEFWCSCHFSCYALFHNSPGKDWNLLKMCSCLLCCSVLSIFMAVWIYVCRYNTAVSEVCHMTLRKGQSQNKDF